MKKIVLLKTDGNVAGYDTIQDGVTAASSGDCVVVYPGTYTEQVTLKNGVDIKCIGVVNIGSSASTGTIRDNNVACVMRLQGFPVITNTGGLLKRIVLQNVGSFIDDFYWEYKAVISQASTAAPAADVTIKNTLGGTPVWTRTAAGKYTLTLVGAFSVNSEQLGLGATKIEISGMPTMTASDSAFIGAMNDKKEASCLVLDLVGSDDAINFENLALSYSSGLVYPGHADGMTLQLIHIKVKP